MAKIKHIWAGPDNEDAVIGNVEEKTKEFLANNPNWDRLGEIATYGRENGSSMQGAVAVQYLIETV